MGRALPSGRGGIWPPAPSRRSAAGPRLTPGGSPRRSGPVPPPPPRPRVARSHPGLRLRVDGSKLSLPQPGRLDAFAWRSSPNKRQDGDPGSSRPAGYLFLTCGDLAAAFLLSTHLGLGTGQLTIPSLERQPRALLRHPLPSRGVLSSYGTDTGRANF